MRVDAPHATPRRTPGGAGGRQVTRGAAGLLVTLPLLLTGVALAPAAVAAPEVVPSPSPVGAPSPSPAPATVVVAEELESEGSDPATSGGAGDTPVQVSGAGFAPGSEVSVAVDGAAAVTAATDGSGGFQARLGLPGAGRQTITATGREPDGTLRVLQFDVTLLAEGGTARVVDQAVAVRPISTQLGAGALGGWLAAGVGAVAVGSAVSYARRRRAAEQALPAPPLVWG